MKLTPKPKRDDHTCDVSRCRCKSSVVLALRDGPWPGEAVALCDAHWLQICDESEGE